MRAAFFFCMLLAAALSPAAQNPSRLVISSIPPGARITIDSVPTGKKSPATFDSLSPGLHEVIVQLRDYCFERRIIELVPGTKTDLSLRLIAISNAQKVHGSDRIGAIILPETPIDSAFRIDDDPAWPGTVVLEPGPHRITWDGGPRYIALDTTLSVDTGRATLLAFTPRERIGRLTVTCDPADALLLIDKIRVEQPFDSTGVHAGSIRLTALRTRYKEIDTTIFIPPNDTISIALTLQPSNDADEDNYPDSLDLCPEEFGTFDGCPERKKRAGLLLQMRTLKSATHMAPLSFMVDLFDGAVRTPTRREFSELYDLCGDGEPFFTGGSGISLVNRIHMSWRALRVSFERGQSLLGREYRKNSVAFVPFDNDTLVLLSDTLRTILPHISSPSYGVSIGFRLSIPHLAILAAGGYRHEEITLSSMGTASDYNTLAIQQGSRSRYLSLVENLPNRVIDNSHWFLTLRAESPIALRGKFEPVFFVQSTLPLPGSSFTKWNSIGAGVSLKFTPRNGNHL